MVGAWTERQIEFATVISHAQVGVRSIVFALLVALVHHHSTSAVLPEC